jgi:UDP-N-acetylmuramate--alanine ligase
MNAQESTINDQRTTINEFRNFYFLGIGGIGMSALARYFNANGFAVSGYDKTPSDLTDELIQEGIAIHFDDDMNLIPAEFLKDKLKTLVIYTPAIPKDHVEYNYLLDNGFTIRKRAEVLASITTGKKTIAVAGTHGKTSTASLIAHILRTANVPFYAFLGGIAANYKTNFLSPESGKEADLVVVEADEFDRSFHRLNPDISIITAIEADHLDIYGTVENLEQAFFEFAHKTKPGGSLIVHKDLVITPPENVNITSYGAFGEAGITAENIEIKDGYYHYDFSGSFSGKNFSIRNLVMGVPGVHNIENSLAAIAATFDIINHDEKIIREALRSFKGVHRRFEVIFRSDSMVYIDDYAHHPTEIKATLQTVKNLYHDKKVLGIFQPHLYTRTRDLAADFAQSLSLVDELILLPIYPARELPIAGVSSEMILENVHCARKKIVDKDALIHVLPESKANVIVTLGAGDIDRLVQPIKEFLENKYKAN